MKLFDKVKRVGFLQTIDDLTGNSFSYLHYLYCAMTHTVYFGSYLAATQGKSIRHHYMQEIIRTYCETYRGPIRLLELGSWAGGSAITWADAIKRHSASNGSVICVDPWTDYLDASQNSLWTHKTMKKAFFNDSIFKLFIHNVLASHHEDIISYLRLSTNETHPLLCDGQFDVIFIDANHSYEAVRKDIRNFAPMVKDGGIICGDDLEHQYDEVDPRFLELNKGHDVIQDPIQKIRYHPGVTLAVHEYFGGPVSVWEGFWAMKRAGDSWEKIAMAADQTTARVPKHLR